MDNKSWVPRIKLDDQSDWDASPYRFAKKADANKEAHWAAVRNNAEHTDVVASSQEPNASFSAKHGAIPLTAKAGGD